MSMLKPATCRKYIVDVTKSDELVVNPNIVGITSV